MSEETTWHVQVEAGDVKVWTLDQLDAAFKAGLIDESTFVLEEGTTEWIQLGTLLGGDDEPEVAPVPVAAAPRPVAAAPAARVVVSEPPPFSFSPISTAPMATDFDDIESSEAFRKKKKPGVVIGLGLTVAAAAVAVFAFTRGASSHAVEIPVQAAVAAPPPVAPAAAPADEKPADTLAAKLTEEQRKRLADLDKAREAKLDAQQKARAASAPHHSGHAKAGKEKNPFHNGGDKFDPLNAKL
jgi:hypothetical protein